MKNLLKTCVFALLLTVHAAFAADLGTAKAQGWIGEQNNGYLGLVKGGAPADVQALVSSVNTQRKAHFAQIAARNGITESEAAKIFAREAEARTQPGNYIQNASGGWAKK